MNNKNILILGGLCIILVALLYYFKTKSNVVSEELEEGLDMKNPPIGGNMSLKKNNINLVLFYAPWCGYCKSVMPDWDRINKKFNNQTINNKKINIVKINCDENSQIAEQYDIQGYPTIKLLSSNSNGKLELFDYDDERNFNKLEQFINIMSNK